MNRTSGETVCSRGAVGAWVAEPVALGLVTQATHSTGIAFWPHVGGFLADMLIAAIFLLVVPLEAIALPSPGKGPFQPREREHHAAPTVSYAGDGLGNTVDAQIKLLVTF